MTIVTTNEDETDTVQRSLAYDGIGNPESDGVRSYTWEHGRQLASLTMDGITWNHTYNSDGLRTVRTSNSKHYSYVYNGDQLTYMTAGDKHMYFAYDANGLPMSMILDGVMYYYVTNVQGDVIGLLDKDGNQVVTYIYDAWGNPMDRENTADSDGIIGISGLRASTVGVLNPLRYRSYVWDSETGLYYLQSRYYNPEIGRFVNADGLTSTGQGFIGNNMFAYCLNNPLLFSDPNGFVAGCSACDMRLPCDRADCPEKAKKRYAEQSTWLNDIWTTINNHNIYVQDINTQVTLEQIEIIKEAAVALWDAWVLYNELQVEEQYRQDMRVRASIDYAVNNPAEAVDFVSTVAGAYLFYLSTLATFGAITVPAGGVIAMWGVEISINIWDAYNDSDDFWSGLMGNGW